MSNAARERARREALRILGRCPDCGNPATRGIYCEEHRLRRLAYKHNKYGVQPSTRRCRDCREVGHHYNTCPRRAR